MVRWPLLLGLAGWLFTSCTRHSEPASPIRHVLVIVGDDHSFTTVGAYGNEYIQTPALDRLAGRGVLFRRAYATSPICSASRQSMLCGKYPHATGVNQLFTPFPDEGNVTVAEHLREQGFATAIIGKTHFNNWLWGPLYRDGPPDHGFALTVGRKEYQDWYAEVSPPPVPDSIPTRQNRSGAGIAWAKNAAMLPVAHRAEHSEAAYFVERTLEFIRSNAEGKSLSWLAFHEPHAPFTFPVDYRGLYHPDSVPLPAGSPEDERWAPEIFRGLTEADRRGIITSYYRSATHMGRQVGRLLDSLEAGGLMDQTLVIYLGDQGYLLNDHRRFEKHSFWEESIRAPLLMAGPGLPKGVVCETPVSFIGLAATICDFLGVEQHPDFQGESWQRRLHQEDEAQQEEYLFAEYLLDNKAMVANRQWKYIFTSGTRDQTLSYATGYGPSGIYHRLYNLEADPGETTNLAYRPEQQQRIQELQQVMLGYFHRTHPEAGHCPQQLTPLGQLVWYCEPRDLGGDYEERPARIFEGKEFVPED